MTAYYNEICPEASAVLRELIANDVIAPGYVDNRSIKDVTAYDLRGFTQCHFFAGAGLWSVGARLAGWPDSRPVWSASCPCQPFSAAGKQAGTDDPRHLWPDLYRIIRTARDAGLKVPVLVGEQVAGAAGYGWFDGVRSDLARENIAARTIDIPACAIDAPHERNRQWWCAVRNVEESDGRGEEGRGLSGSGEGVSADLERSHDQSGGPDGCAVAHPEGFGSGRIESLGGSQGRTSDGWPYAASPLVDTSIDGRIEGRAESEILRWWATIAGADVCKCGYPATPCDKSKHDFGHVCVEGNLNMADSTVTSGEGRNEQSGRIGNADGRSANGARPLGNTVGARLEGQRGHGDHRPGWSQQNRSTAAADGGIRRNGSWWADAEWLVCHDGKARRAKPSIPMLVNGMAGRVGLWRIAGNSIVPQLAAEVFASIIDAERMIGL